MKKHIPILLVTMLLITALFGFSPKGAADLVALNVKNDTVFQNLAEFEANDSFVLVSDKAKENYTISVYQIVITRNVGKEIRQQVILAENNGALLHKQALDNYYKEVNNAINVNYEIRLNKKKYPNQFITIYKHYSILKKE